MCPRSVWIDTWAAVGVEQVASGLCPCFSTGVWGQVGSWGGCTGYAHGRWICL